LIANPVRTTFAVMRHALALAAFVTLFAGSAEAASRFDLKCVGTDTLNKNTRPWSTEIRIDLAGRKYCGALGPCVTALEIARVEPGFITFIDDKDDEGAFSKISFFVNRGTGELSYMAAGSDIVDVISAHCVPAAFQPLPAAKF
jgi:hypothetical protein